MLNNARRIPNELVKPYVKREITGDGVSTAVTTFLNLQVNK